MSTFDDLARHYVEAWNETDPVARRERVGALFSAGVRYVDPVVTAEGRDALAATIGAVQEQFPAARFRLAGPVDGHHEQVRFTWELGPDDGPAPVVGFDVATLDADGRIAAVLGFLDRVPEAAA